MSRILEEFNIKTKKDVAPSDYDLFTDKDFD